MPHPPDQQLVYRVSAYRDSAAFVELHRRYFDKIRALIAYKILRVEDAEDLSSQVFVNLWEYLTRTGKKEVQNFRALIYKIARNEVANFYRAQGKFPKTIELDDPEEYLEVADGREDLFEKQLRAHDLDYLIECVQKLPEPYREIVALRFFEELDIQEIAEIIEKTPGNTRVLIHRGIHALRKIMQGPAQGKFQL